MTELKPCPCCGSKKVAPYDYGLPDTMIGCTSCGLATKWFSTRAQAIAAWNTRAAEEGKAELVEKAEALLAMIGQNDCRIYASDPPVVELRAALARVLGEG